MLHDFFKLRHYPGPTTCEIGQVMPAALEDVRHREERGDEAAQKARCGPWMASRSAKLAVAMTAKLCRSSFRAAGISYPLFRWRRVWRTEYSCQ